MNHGRIMVSVEHFEACPPRLRWLFFYKVGPLQVINGILAPWSRVITLVTHFKVHLSGSFSISRNYGIFRWKDSEKGPKSDIHWFYVRRPWGYCVVCTKLIFSDMWNMVSLWYLHLVYWKIYATTFPLLLGTCPKAYRPTKRRINSLWPMGKVLYSRHHMIGIEYRICCGLAGLAFMCNNPFLFVFLFLWGQGWISDYVFPHLSGEGC